jgi:hypothetical protein
MYVFICISSLLTVSAIDYIAKLKSDAGRMSMAHRELERTRIDFEQSRQENHSLKEELVNLRAHLQRVDPSAAQVYGGFSEHMNHENQNMRQLPQMNTQPPPSWGQGPPPQPPHMQAPPTQSSQAMQGVEYPNSMYGGVDRR